ncbi:MAG: hypothetical protein FJ308_05890 [Planctomycetes bacterium]|nr:hypothetical protein [Planctomycetota bacterium]
MVEFLFESPFYLGGLGLVVTILTAYGWLQTGNTIALRSTVGLAMATVAFVALNIFVVTDREAIRTFLLDTASELQRNEATKVSARIHPEATQMVLDLEAQLPTIHFKTVRIKTFHAFDFTPARNPTSVSVRMNAVVEGERLGQQGTVPRWVRVTLEKYQGQWKIVDYDHREPHYEMLNEEGRSRLDTYRR